MTQTPRYIIGIDPDIDKSGVALLNKSSRQLKLQSLSFFELYNYLESLKEPVIVIIEGGWLNSIGNYHPSKNIRTASKIGNYVGANQQVGKLIVEMCIHLDIKHEIVRPLRKMWKGADKKITHAELAYFTGIKGRTNQEVRDAVLLAWVHAGLPIKTFNTLVTSR